MVFLNTKNFFSGKAGFTIIEVLIFIFIFILVMTSAFSLFFWLDRSSIKAKVERDALENASFAMNIIISEIKSAKTVYEPGVFDSQLSLETAKNLPEGEKTTYVDFYLCDERICQKRESQNSVFLTSESVRITNFSVSKIITGTRYSIQIKIAAEYKNPSANPKYQGAADITSTASLRLH